MYIFIYKLYKNISIKRILKTIIPFIIIIIGFNIVSFVNYKHYNIYTYNELENSSFEKAYNKILQIKDDEKEEYFSIPKSTFYKLAETSKKFGLTKEEIDKHFESLDKTNEQIDNGNIIWFTRNIIYNKYRFKDGKEANDYYERLNKELDQLFKDGTLERESSFPIIYINLPNKNEITKIPGNLIKTIWYTSSYKNIKTYTNKQLSTYDIASFDNDIS